MAGPTPTSVAAPLTRRSPHAGETPGDRAVMARAEVVDGEGATAPRTTCPHTSPPAMHPDSIARVRASWRLAHRGPLAATLHAHLVASAPGVVARLAAAGVTEPAEELLAWVDYVVHLLDADGALPALAHAAEAFGREWNDLGVTAADVAAARAALFRTLDTLLGDRLDVPTAAAWGAAYTALAGALYRGLRAPVARGVARAA